MRWSGSVSVWLVVCTLARSLLSAAMVAAASLFLASRSLASLRRRDRASRKKRLSPLRCCTAHRGATGGGLVSGGERRASVGWLERVVMAQVDGHEWSSYPSGAELHAVDPCGEVEAAQALPRIVRVRAHLHHRTPQRLRINFLRLQCKERLRHWTAVLERALTCTIMSALLSAPVTISEVR